MPSYKYHSLGNNVIPKHYNLVFEPDMKKFDFFCREEIEVEIKKPTKIIRLNAKELKIKKAWIEFFDSKDNAKIKYDLENEEVVLTFKKPISGNRKIFLEFTGRHNDGMYGFYRSKYKDEKGKENHILTTQFEAPNARAAFVCFDEPSFKATFDVSFIIDAELDGISNMPVVEEKINTNNKKTIKFATTPVMSTYLLYLAVGKFDYVEDAPRSSDGNSGRVKIRIYCVPGKKHLTNLALEYSRKFLDYFENYFGIKYPLPKCDFIAIPDFSSGAMENWGAITFREIILLGDEKTSVATKEYIAEVIAHELAHQWFGNLVTMQWWDGLWLNESFATFMAQKAVHEIFPEWDYNLRFYEDIQNSAFSADCLKSTHPISVKIKHVKEVPQIFDRISYEKGCSVLHMLESYVGEENFRNGLNSYLKKHAYKNAVKEDLWNSLAESSNNEEVSKIMSVWVNKPGYPIIRVEKENNNYKLWQKRFLLSGDKKDGNWPIPITFSGNEKNFVMDKEASNISSHDPLIKLNRNQSSFYRVHYDQKILEKLGEQVKSKNLSNIDSWGIVNDLFILARTGRIKVDAYVSFVENYCMDSEYPLNSTISSDLLWIWQMSKGLGIRTDVKKTAIEFHKNLLVKFGWERKPEEKNADTMLRSQTIAALGELEHEETIEKATKIFDSFIKKKTEIDFNMRGAIYKIATGKGNKKLFDSFSEKYKKEQNPEENRRLLATLGNFGDKDLGSKALNFSQSKDVRLQDSFVIPSVISGNAGCKEILWPWTKTNWKKIMKRYDPGTHMLRKFVDNLGYVNDNKTKKEISKFFKNKANNRSDIEMPIKQVLERANANIAFIKANSR